MEQQREKKLMCVTLSKKGIERLVVTFSKKKIYYKFGCTRVMNLLRAILDGTNHIHGTHTKKSKKTETLQK
jgi:hypothetical protein